MSPHSQIRGSHVDGEDVFVKRKIRCVLVHDHVLVRQGLRRLLEDEPELEVVAEAGNASEALQRAFQHRPDFILADSRTMAVPAEEAELLLLGESPASRVFLFGQRVYGPSTPLGDMTQSEYGHVPAHTSIDELISMVKRRQHSFPSGVHEMPASSEQEWSPVESPSSRKRSLTAREHEVLKLLAEGQTVRSAAGVLGLSAKTVDAHKFNLMRKLGIHNKAELVMWAIQKKVVKFPVNY